MDLEGVKFIVLVLAGATFALGMGVVIAALCRAAAMDLPDAPIKSVTTVQCEACGDYKGLSELTWQEPVGFVCRAHSHGKEAA
jgi:hypothetical protein